VADVAGCSAACLVDSGALDVHKQGCPYQRRLRVEGQNEREEERERQLRSPGSLTPTCCRWGIR
jgi:hypothetical protein